MNLVLLSGGMDSALTLYHALGLEQRVMAMSFAYGQTHCVQENQAAASIAHHAGVPLTHVKLGSSLCGVGTPGAVVPARNIMFLSWAANWLDVQGGGTVFFGACAEDEAGFPDCREEFVLEFNRLLRLCELKVQVEAPWIHITKTMMLLKMIEVPGVEEAVRLSYSCYAGGREPCGWCEACLKRDRALQQLWVRRER